MALRFLERLLRRELAGRGREVLMDAAGGIGVAPHTEVRGLPAARPFDRTQGRP